MSKTSTEYPNSTKLRFNASGRPPNTRKDNSLLKYGTSFHAPDAAAVSPDQQQALGQSRVVKLQLHNRSDRQVVPMGGGGAVASIVKDSGTQKTVTESPTE